MSIDCRTRRHRDHQDLDRDEVFDGLISEALSRNAALVGRGLQYKGLPPVTLSVDGRSVTLCERAGVAQLLAGDAPDAAVAVLDSDALSDLVQDRIADVGAGAEESEFAGTS